VFYGSNLYRNDNPCWISSNATETPKVPAAAFQLLPPASGPWERPVSGLGGGLAGRVTRSFGDACGIGLSWLIGLRRRAGTRLYALTDAEARWWHWQVTERCGGLIHQFRDARFDRFRPGRAAGGDGLRAGLASPDPTPPDCPGPGDRR
jgi:hypothetical protein